MDIVRLLLKRIVGMFVIVTLASFLLACLIWLLPGDPANLLLAGSGTPETVAVVRRELFLDRGIFRYWWHWYSGFIRGDFGYYYLNGGTRPVSEVIKSTLPVSLQLVLYAQFVALFFSIPLGLVSAYKENSRFDRIVSSTLFTLVSFPGFALALIMSLIFAVQLGWVDPIGYVHPSENLFEHLKLMILPVLSIAVGLTSSYTRLLRTDVVATLKEDYVTMAASKGISNRRVLWKHVFRPSSTTLLTSAALNMGGLIGGVVVIETIFVIPGIGYEIFYAIGARQVIAMQTFIALISFGYVFFNTTIDLFTNIIDPRTRERRV